MSSPFESFKEDPRIVKQSLINKYSAARTNLLLMVIFSAINLILLTCSTGLYFMFSAALPYFVTDLGLTLCGMYPKEYYGDAYGEMTFADPIFFIVCIALAICILVFYLFAWIYSKGGKVVWLKLAFGFFAVDTLFMVLGLGAGSYVTNLLFHVWLLVMLYMGIDAHKKLRIMKAEPDYIEGEFRELESDFDKIPTEDQTSTEDELEDTPSPASPDTDE